MNKSAIVNALRTARAVRAATLAARDRTNDQRIGVSVQNGYFRAEIITDLPNGSCIVDPLTGYMTAQQTVDFLNSL